MRVRAWIALLLFAATLFVFAPVREHEFVGYDDYTYVVDNANLFEGPTVDALLGAFARPYEHNWIPLTWISLQIDYALYGRDPAGYLLTNVALHALSAVLLFLALAQMTGGVWRSAFVAAVFALHPLHVESVAWVTERKDTLSGFFWMLTLCAYARYSRRPGSLRRGLPVALGLVLGLLAKPMLVTLPFVLLLLDYWPLDRLRGAEPSAWPRADALRAAIREKLPLFALALAAGAITYSVQRATGSVAEFEAIPLGARVANALDAYAIYLWKALWPTGLAVFYPHPMDVLPAARWLGAGALLAAISAALLRAAARHPYAIVGWLWYLGTLVPVIGLVQVGMQARADRYMYLPLVGLSILFAWGAVDLAARFRVPRAVLAAGAFSVLIALAVCSRIQLQYWRNSEALFARALAVTEHNHVAHKGLGAALLLQDHPDEAARHFGAAARIAPGWSEPRIGLADVALASGRVEEALRMYAEELRRAPDDMALTGRYGMALGMAGRFAEARPLLERAVAAHPGVAQLHFSLSIVESALGRPRESVRHAREALRIQPDFVEAANGLAWTLATCPDPAVRDAAQAIRWIERDALASGNPGHLDTLAAAYAAAGRFDDAIATQRRAAEAAEQLGNRAEASALRARLSLYERRIPYVDSPG